MFVLRWIKVIVGASFLVYSVVSFFMIREGWSGVHRWLILTVCLTFVSAVVYLWSQRQREQWLRTAPLPHFLKRKVRQTYPHLSGNDLELVEHGLRQFFLSCLKSNKRFVAMPSRVVDAMWHEFILHTKGYKEWCLIGFGGFLHHTPAEALGQKARNNDGLRRAWYWACKDEAIDPYAPLHLPLLFALDAKLQIDKGFSYSPNCADINQKNAIGGDGSGQVYCGTDFSNNSYAGDAKNLGGSEPSRDSNSGDSDGDWRDGSSDGCSGSGCGSSD